MIIQNEDLKEAILNIINDAENYIQDLNTLIDVSDDQEISDIMLESTIRNLKHTVDYLSKILTEDNS